MVLQGNWGEVRNEICVNVMKERRYLILPYGYKANAGPDGCRRYEIPKNTEDLEMVSWQA